ncbi:TetR/AcrR family transcriptional regulator [Yinghuangia soli]|uniref:TetR family transcriptional regulator n=1 Tax=Yinghuangia soli TaxID=2908204 RepID=A0AA41U586_9ACTN|nr:TetR family transcriptional regulator [Yinghuangia soli]MCF2533776.1 TetR family transcriptional regulator [Yinghuangia soli]
MSSMRSRTLDGMAKTAPFTLDAAEIVDAAAGLLYEQGLAGVTMRSVAARLGVSSMPIYNRFANKNALLDALAEHVFSDVAPTPQAGEAWPRYAARWARSLRAKLRTLPDGAPGLLTLSGSREGFTAASRPLMAALQAGGLTVTDGVRICRMLTWTTIAITLMGCRNESDDELHPHANHITADEADELFDLQLRLLLQGLAGEHPAAAG